SCTAHSGTIAGHGPDATPGRASLRWAEQLTHQSRVLHRLAHEKARDNAAEPRRTGRVPEPAERDTADPATRAAGDRAAAVRAAAGGARPGDGAAPGHGVGARLARGGWRVGGGGWRGDGSDGGDAGRAGVAGTESGLAGCGGGGEVVLAAGRGGALARARWM